MKRLTVYRHLGTDDGTDITDISVVIVNLSLARSLTGRLSDDTLITEHSLH